MSKCQPLQAKRPVHVNGKLKPKPNGGLHENGKLNGLFGNGKLNGLLEKQKQE